MRVPGTFFARSVMYSSFVRKAGCVMYGVIRLSVSSKHYPELFAYCSSMTALYKNLKNAALFIIRQWYTAYGKTDLQPLQKEVIQKVEDTCRSTGRKKPGRIISNRFIELLMRLTENPDYYARLPRHSAQYAIKEAVNDFKNWRAAVRAYDKDPSKFTGRPKMPKYIKRHETTLTSSNQECVIKDIDGISYLKLPLTKELIQIHIPKNARVKEVKIKPYYGRYVIVLTYESDGAEMQRDSFEPVYSGAIDLGVDNLAALVSNDGLEPLLYKGGVLKSKNQWYNRQRAVHIACLTKGHDPKTVSTDTKLLRSVSNYRSDFIRDYLHKVSTHIVKSCLKRNIGTLYIGKNTQWKTKAHMSKQSNQEFVQIPHCTLIWMIRYKAERYGITVIEQEESYTSKASFLDHDEIPEYRDNEDHVFSGKRIRRGLYRSKDGTLLNADINGSANILRKAEPEAFAGIKDYRFLQKIKAVPFRELYPCGTVTA